MLAFVVPSPLLAHVQKENALQDLTVVISHLILPSESPTGMRDLWKVL